MINNRTLVLVAAALASIGLASGALISCQRNRPPPLTGYQGVVELDERVLAFELGGRVTRVDVERGDPVTQATELARVDDTIEETARDARKAELDVARSQVSLLEAGARPEEIRSLAARVRSIKTTEALLQKNLERERKLLARGVTSQSAVDEIETRLNATIADRQSVEQKLKALKRGARKQEIEGAKSRVEAADKGLALQSVKVERHTLHAPADGVVLDVHVEPGEVVAPGTPVVTVGDTKHPYADVFVPVGALDGIHVGTKARVRVDSTREAFDCEVEHVSRRTEFTPRFLFSERERPSLVVRVRLRIEDPEQKLHAGVPAFASFAPVH
jgi:HlyD family secretion protein